MISLLKANQKALIKSSKSVLLFINQTQIIDLTQIIEKKSMKRSSKEIYIMNVNAVQGLLYYSNTISNVCFMYCDVHWINMENLVRYLVGKEMQPQSFVKSVSQIYSF